jgi:ATP-dependent Clp protease ATP-binding subunit ClpA
VDFRQSIVIMTSNLGGQYLRNLDPDDQAAFELVRLQIQEELRRSFRPEFLNRIDETIVFRPLGRRDLEQIVTLQAATLVTRLAGLHITLEITPAARALLAKEGYNPDFGARPLKRLIQRTIENPLSRRLLAGEFREGDTVVADAQGSEIVLRKATPVAADSGSAPRARDARTAR